MNSDKMAAIPFLSNLNLKQGIGLVYVIVDFICKVLINLQGAQSENYMMKNSCPQRNSNSRPLDCEAFTVTMRSDTLSTS